MIRDRGTNFGTIEKNFSKRSEVAGGGVGERGKEKETEREKERNVAERGDFVSRSIESQILFRFYFYSYSIRAR